MTDIKFIYFDLGGVLINIERIKHDLAILCGKEPKDFGDILEKINWQAAKGKIDTAAKMLKKNMDIDIIAECTGYTIEFIKELAKEVLKGQ